MFVVAGLGNPGAEYEDTRHNVGWWALDRLAYDWGFGSFVREGSVFTSSGSVAGEEVLLAKPTGYVNRSGGPLAELRRRAPFDAERELLVVVDDVALDVGRVRLRGQGGPGGHNGLKSVEAALGTQDYARLRIGVGRVPEGRDMAEWVLSAMPPEDEDAVLALLTELAAGVEIWIREGSESAMNVLNR